MSAVAKSDAREARERAGRIRVGMVQYLHTLADVAAAYAARDWMALGYESWESYVDGEYSEHRLKLSPEHRQKAVAELRLAGMSQRAIGSALGVNRETVAKDLREVAGNQPPEIQGADGKTYAATRTSSPTGSETAPIADLPQEPDRSGSTAAEVESSPSADGTETDFGVTVEPALPGVGPGDGESVPAPTAAAVDNPPAAVGVTLDDWSQQLRDRVADVHEFMAVDFPADAFAAATESDWAEVIDLIEQMAGYGKSIRSAYVSRMLEATR